jgi:hypothetical protein
MCRQLGWPTYPEYVGVKSLLNIGSELTNRKIMGDHWNNSNELKRYFVLMASNHKVVKPIDMGQIWTKVGKD